MPVSTCPEAQTLATSTISERKGVTFQESATLIDHQWEITEIAETSGMRHSDESILQGPRCVSHCHADIETAVNEVNEIMDSLEPIG